MGSFTGEKAEEAGGDCCRNEPGAPYRSEDLVRLMMADVLREEGFQVIEVSDAVEAISILKAMPVDVVITDLRMSAVAHRSAAACACLREPSLLLVTLSPSKFCTRGANWLRRGECHVPSAA
jgi:hypothetical protein